MKVSIRGVSLRIETSGERKNDKPALFFVHGAGGDASLWAPQERFFRHHTVVCRVELPGHGDSGGRGEREIKAYTGWVREAADVVLEDTPFVLVGHSMGGAIALDMAISGNRGLAGIVLVATGSKLGVTSIILRLLKEDFEGFLKTIDSAALGPKASPDVRSIVEAAIKKSGPGVTHGDFTACNGFDVRESLGVIRVPALVICGEEDRMTPVDYSEFLARNIKGATLELVPGAGHIVMLEAPETVNSAIEAFLEEAFP